MHHSLLHERGRHLNGFHRIIASPTSPVHLSASHEIDSGHSVATTGSEGR
jgi:hypothetical protein